MENYKKYSKTHDVKIEKQYYDRIISGQKRFEIRYNDRDYQVGDWVYLECLDECGSETGKKLAVKIIYTSNFEQKNGYIVFGFTVGEEKDEG